MSASNWAQCPKCKKLEERAREVLAAKVESSYGKVSPNEYLRLVKELSEKPSYITNGNLREDYQIGLDEDGNFFVVYSCSCETCGFSYKYKHTERIKVTE